MTVALDSWAVLEWLQGNEPAFAVVEAARTSGRPLMSWINTAEVFYRVSRVRDAEVATEYVNEFRFEFDLELPTERRILEAARLKAVHPIALADCFAISCAADHDATLLTGDPEILAIQDLPCRVQDLRG